MDRSETEKTERQGRIIFAPEVEAITGARDVRDAVRVALDLEFAKSENGSLHKHRSPLHAALTDSAIIGRIGDDESVTDSAGEYVGEPGDHATVDVGEFGTVRRSLQDRDLVMERDGFGFEPPAGFAADDDQLGDGDEQPVDECAKSGTELGGRAGSRERARLRPATPQGPAGRADRVSGTYTPLRGWWASCRHPTVFAICIGIRLRRTGATLRR